MTVPSTHRWSDLHCGVKASLARAAARIVAITHMSLLATLAACLAPPRATAPATDHRAPVLRAWQAIADVYFHPGFDRARWQAAREQITSRTYASREEANASMRGLLEQLGDPAVRILTREQTATFLLEVSGAPHVGVGLAEMLSVDMQGSPSRVAVVTPIVRAPAALAGMRSGDVIEHVDGVRAADWSLAETMERLRGDPGSTVRVGLRRGERVIEVHLRRDSVRLPEPVASGRMVADADGTKIGYVRVYQFTARAGDDVRRVVESLVRQDAQMFVLDLRDNPGGIPVAAQAVAGVFAGARPMALMADRTGARELIAAGEPLTDRPLAVLINEGTASAAELVATALRASRHATIVGTKSIGKGIVHGLRPLGDGSSIVLPTARIRTLDGTEVLHLGIAPDVDVPMAESPVLGRSSIAAASTEDVQFMRAVAVLRAAHR